MAVKAILKKAYGVALKLKGGIGYKSFGERTIIRKPMRILGKKYIEIGAGCDIMDGLRMEAVSEWNGERYCPEIRIGDGVTVGQNCHFTCADHVFIGKGCDILPNVLITDMEHRHEKDKSFAESGLEVGSVDIGEYVSVGMGACIIGNRKVKIGRNAVIAAKAVVKRDVPEGAVVAGIPARIVKYVGD